jgi:PAS domain S-box-containing protein
LGYADHVVKKAAVCYARHRFPWMLAERDERVVETAGSLQSFVGHLIEARRRPAAMVGYLAALWAAGLLLLAIVTVVCFRLQWPSSVVAFVYLMVIVLLSLLDSFVSSAFFSIVAVLLLNYFFVEPIFSLEIDSTNDLAALAAFAVTSFAITGLVRRVYRLGDEQRARASLLDLTHDAIFVRDEAGVISYWNRGAEQFYGWTKAEAIGKTTHALLRTVFPVPLAEIMATLQRTGHWEGELRHFKRGGSQAVVSSRWALQPDPTGRAPHILETNNDITERKQVEEALQRSQAAYLTEAQRLSSTGSFGWRPSSDEVFWSEESYRIYGYETSATPALALMMDRVHPEDAAFVRQTFERAADGRDIDVEHRLLMPDGSVKHLHVVAHALNGGARVLQLIGAVMDVTAARQAQERLAAAQAELAHVTRVSMIGQLTASIGHEVNQPLAAIVTNGEAAMRWLARDPPDLGEVRDALRDIIADGKRTSEVVQRIRALIKKTDFKMERLDLNEVVGDAASLVQRAMADQRIDLQVDLGSALPPVRGDRVQLQQVVINLTVNGIQAMADNHDRPRRLRIESRAEGTGAVVSVADTGPGIDPGIAERLFDAFQTTKPDGMGMGLSICRAIVEAHGGRIWNEQAAGTGATFRFSLPAATD